jgi:hypothetical protein
MGSVTVRDFRVLKVWDLLLFEISGSGCGVGTKIIFGSTQDL